MREIYADNASTTKPSPAALKAMRTCLEDTWGNPSNAHHLGQAAREKLDTARETIAQCIGCSPREIIFTSGGTESDNLALRSAAWFGAKAGKRHIVTTAIEHHAVLHTLQALEEEGFSVTYLPVDGEGLVSADDVAEAITAETCLVSVMFANNEIGTIEPVPEIAAVCRERGVLFHTDAVQAAGHVALDVGKMQIDLLSLSAHKFHGVKGAGALYVRQDLPMRPLLFGGGQERGRRAGTENVPGVVAMAAALWEACAHMEENAAYVTELRDRLFAGLKEMPQCVINGSLTRRLPGNVHVCFAGVEGLSLLILLDQAGICASAGSACTAGSLEPSHVLRAIGRSPTLSHGALRLTLSEENTPEDVEYILDVVQKAVLRLRSFSPVWREMQLEARE